MSLLMFRLNADGVGIVVDTLAVGHDWRPNNVVSKVAALPHAGVVVAFTGIAQVGFEWVSAVQSRMMVRDIDMLDTHTPGALADVYADVEKDLGPLRGTSTVYHFGFSDARQQYVGYAYRSALGFVSDPLPEGGFAVKPPPVDKPSEAPTDLPEWIALAEQIREEQEQRPASERLHIGGQLILVTMQSRVITLSIVHHFSGFEEQWLEMNGIYA